jgi:predicted dehydrogenase
MLRVALVGCGKIADAHAAQIQRIRGCSIVAVCDREKLMARQLAERFAVRRHYDDLDRLLEEARPHVVHITTPPQSHFELARRCLDQGCHVYLEKPFTQDGQEAEDLVSLAERRGLKVTVGHDGQFSPVARRMRALVREGYVGDGPVHVESYYGYDLGDVTYARAFLGDKDHWVRRLPGGLFQNVISHGLARVAEFLSGDRVQVTACGFVSPLLSTVNDDVIDELRVMLVDERRTTAFFTFSSQMRPILNQLRVFGSRNGLVLDDQQQTLVKLRGTAFKSYLERFLPPVILAGQYLANARRSIGLFLSNEFHMEAGKHELIAAFYRSIVEDTDVPIPYREILLTARVMDAIVAQVTKPSSGCAVEATQC